MDETTETVTVDAMPSELETAGAVLTPEMVNEGIVRLTTRPERNPDTMYMYPTAFADHGAYATPPRGMPIYPTNYAIGRPGDGGVDVDMPTTEYRPTGRFGYDVAQAAERRAIELNRHGDPIIEVDLSGTELTQSNLNYVHDQLCAARMNYPDKTPELRIKRMNTRNLPRLIADTGYIYELLVKMIDEREAAA